MLSELFGSKNRERVLLFLFANQQGYAREIARFYDTDLTPIQNQLKRMEKTNILISKPVGKTLVFMLNSRYDFYDELNELLEKAIELLPAVEQNKLTAHRSK